MFDFNEDKLTYDQVMEVASVDGLPPLRVAINANGYRQSQDFWSSKEEMLCANLNNKHGVVVKNIHRQARRGKGVVGVRSIYESIRKILPFIGKHNVIDDLEDNILPALQDSGIVCVIGDKVYAHPAMMNMDDLEVRKWCNPWLDNE